MTDTPDTPHQPKMEAPKRRVRVVSAVWLVPIVAVLIALAIAYQSYANRGVLVAIAFPDASGVEIGQTSLRFREVTVGVVEDVGFSADLSQVNVYVRVSRNIAPYLDEDASFWVVQPEVTARGVEGLNTILSGTYIEGTWDSEIGDSRTEFQGDERAPIVPPGVDGTAIVLSSRESSRLGPGAPILYRGIEVGEVAQPRLSPDGSEIRIDAFVRAPYDRQLSTATRFWDASGVSVGLGAGGVDLRIGSLASILEGGLVFDTLVSGGDQVRQGHVYNIFADESAARASAFEAPSARSVTVSVLFPSAVSGLSSGASVRYQGVRVGVVTSITGFIRPDDPTQAVQLLAVLSLQPTKMGLDTMRSELDGLDFLGDLVRDGMRAQLTSTSLFGGDLAVDLVQRDDAIPGRLEIGVTDTPLIPSIEPDASDMAASAAGLMDRIADLPVEELLTSATDLLDNLNRIAGSEDTRAIPGAALAALEDGRALIASAEIANALTDLEAIADSVAQVTEQVVADDLVTNLSATLTAATEAAGNIAVGTTDLDALTARLTVLAEDASTLLADEATQALPDAALSALTEGEALIRDGRNILSSPQVASVLIDIERLTSDLSAIAADVAGSDLAPRLTEAVTAATEAAQNIAAGTVDLDRVTDNINALVQDADALLSDEATQALPGAALALMEDGRAIIASPEVQAIITDLAATAADVRALTAQLAAAEAAARLTSALEAAEVAAQSVATSVENLPELSASAERVMAQAEELGAGLNRLTAKAEALALDELVNSTTSLMQTADAFLSSDEADDVPVALVDTLEEVRRTIEVIRTGGTLDNLNATLRSASGAADSVAIAARDLPALVARLQTLTASATGVLTSYGDGSRVNQELYSALRAATRAAEDVSSLARTIERNPNSLLLGR
ncbi:hypothetical protein JANAI62_34220 [Jannaschia pagri]|uniref:Mce/MlaD domain-containing protein n=1 Tax=Jannaschia pagri TaxID=2829797 RepID=A0ABQ4NQV9_9RHOB|nr:MULTISPECIES: MlaD family protein [unclassified Jannaschia]GIT92964.1 hypothetical protein JANAI61_34220 [Jannaschia sp. AI_61]GIT96799.1 hypothetical protein JANAI62_34220 [Jannaschia sp. AI_62]